MSATALASMKFAAAEVDKPGGFFLIEACGTSVKGTVEPIASYQRIWSSETASVNQVTRAHGYTPGKALVERARELGTACRSYEDVGHQWDVLGPMALPTYPGIDDAYAFCEHWNSPGSDGVWRCRAYLGRGTVTNRGGLVTLISSMTAYGKAKAVKLLTDALALAAPVFAAA